MFIFQVMYEASGGNGIPNRCHSNNMSSYFYSTHVPDGKLVMAFVHHKMGFNFCSFLVKILPS